MSDPDDKPGGPAELDVAAAIVDIFVYVVVLNLFVEYLPQVISESFTMSLLTAVLLKGVLEVVVLAKNRVKARFRQASTPIGWECPVLTDRVDGLVRLPLRGGPDLG